MWNQGNTIGKLYILDKDDFHRVGDCWMNGRLLEGDVVLCTALAGDYYNKYVLIRTFENGLEAVLEASFGAYKMGTELDWQPSETEYHRLLAGEMVRSGINEHPLSAELKKRKAR